MVAAALSRAGLAPQKNPGRVLSAMRGWDLLFSLSGEEYTVEVKYDIKSAVTGNVAIEYWNVKSGCPSGITATTAALWAFAFPCGEVWLANTERLRAYIAETPPTRTISCGGDDNAALKLYRRSTILPAVFVRVDDLDPEEVARSVARLVAEGSIASCAA